MGTGVSNLPQLENVGRGGGLVVSVLVFYSDDPSLNATKNFYAQKDENNEKEVGVGPT